MMAAIAADIEIGLELAVEQHLLAGRAFLSTDCPASSLLADDRADFGQDEIGQPVGQVALDVLRGSILSSGDAPQYPRRDVHAHAGRVPSRTRVGRHRTAETWRGLAAGGRDDWQLCCAFTRINAATPIRPMIRRDTRCRLRNRRRAATPLKPVLPKSLRPLPALYALQSFEMVLSSIVTAAFSAMARPHRISASVSRLMAWSAMMFPANIRGCAERCRAADLPVYRHQLNHHLHINSRGTGGGERAPDLEHESRVGGRRRSRGSAFPSIEPRIKRIDPRRQHAHRAQVHTGQIVRRRQCRQGIKCGWALACPPCATALPI